MTDYNPEAQEYTDQDIELEQMLYARHVEINSPDDLTTQRATSIPALFSTMYKFIQNPSSVSVETYKRMIDTDDTIGSGVDFLTTCLAVRLGTYTHPNKELAKWVNERLRDVKGGWFNAVKELLSASWAGFAVSEKIWENNERHGFVPRKIVALPPTTLMFETERTGELTEDGILQYQRNWNPMALGTGIGYFGGMVGVGYGFMQQGDARPDPFAKFGDMPFPMRVNNSWNYLSIRIPKQKCIHYSFDAQGKFGNPYGRSLLRRIYKYYVLKDSVIQMLAVALDRKGTPLTIVYADPNTTLQDDTKVQAAGTGNVKGKRVGVRADKAAQDAFSRVHNDSVIVLPGKKGQIFEVEALIQNSNTGDFISTLDFCNKSMLRGLLIPSLIFGNGDGTGSYSLGQEHAKTFTKIMDGMLEGLEDVLIEQLVMEMIKYNWPATYWQDAGFGSFAPKDFSDEDMEKISRIWETAITSGVIDPTDLQDLNRMRETLGFGERTTIIEKPETDLFGDTGSDLGATDHELSGGANSIGGMNEMQDTALNGAQVSSLVEILNNVTTGLIPKESAAAIIQSAFPSFNDEKIRKMRNPITVNKDNKEIKTDGNP
jgi:hypothetical protein